MATRTVATRIATGATTPKQRAHALLRALLSEAEYKQVMRSGYLTVQSPSRSEVTYRIPRGPGFVRVYEERRPMVDLCVQPLAALPWDDLVLMHKLLIESDETAYLATANRFPSTARRPRPAPEYAFRLDDLLARLTLD